MRRIPLLPPLLLLALAASCRHADHPGGADGGGGGAGASGATAADKRTSPPADGYLRYRLREDPPKLDPADSGDVVSAAVLLNVFDGLVTFDPATLAIAPAVASSWTISEDGRTYDFTLRSDVKFHDGTPVTADDVSWSFHRLISPDLNAERRWILEKVVGAAAYSRGEASAISGIEVVSPTHVRITIESAFAPFLQQLAMEAGAILPRSRYDVPKADAASYLRHPVGCGPFAFQEWQQGNFLKLKAFDGYYGGKPALAGITYRIIGDKVTALEAYKNGDLDVVDEIPAGQRTVLKQELGDQYKQWPQLGVYYFGMNQENPPFAGNKKLRQAINHAVNRTYICENLQEGKDIPAFGILPPGVPGHDPSTLRDPYDPELAKKLLAEAGYPGGKGLDPIVLYYNTDDSHQRVALQVQRDLQEIGVTLTLRNLEWGAYLDLVEGTDEKNTEVGFYRMGWIADYPDPDNFMTVRLSCDYFGPKGNYDRYCNPEFEKLIDRARETTDTAERLALYRQAEQIALDDAVWLFIYYYRDEALVKPYVTGFALSPQGDYTAPLEAVRFQ